MKVCCMGKGRTFADHLRYIFPGNTLNLNAWQFLKSYLQCEIQNYQAFLRLLCERSLCFPPLPIALVSVPVYHWSCGKYYCTELCRSSRRWHTGSNRSHLLTSLAISSEMSPYQAPNNFGQKFSKIWIFVWTLEWYHRQHIQSVLFFNVPDHLIHFWESRWAVLGQEVGGSPSAWDSLLQSYHSHSPGAGGWAEPIQTRTQQQRASSACPVPAAWEAGEERPGSAQLGAACTDRFPAGRIPKSPLTYVQDRNPYSSPHRNLLSTCCLPDSSSQH